MISKYRASKISQSLDIVAAVQIDKIIKDSYQPTNKDIMLKKITYRGLQRILVTWKICLCVELFVTIVTVPRSPESEPGCESYNPKMKPDP